MASSFAENCYQALKKVPAGQVTTYGDLAQAIGKPHAARAVGRAMNANPSAPEVPCHRVVGSDGTLVGYARGLEVKIQILTEEGIEILNGKVVGLEKVRYKF